MVYQWYPGHMSKAKRQMQEELKLIDVVIEILDARIPYSSKNPDIDRMANGKSRILLLNKADLADEKKTAEWKKYYEAKGFFVAAINSKNGTGVKETVGIINKACAAKLEKDRKKGILARPLRAMIAGIPNSGKSTFINALAGKACTKTQLKGDAIVGNRAIDDIVVMEIIVRAVVAIVENKLSPFYIGTFKALNLQRCYSKEIIRDFKSYQYRFPTSFYPTPAICHIPGLLLDVGEIKALSKIFIGHALR